MKKNFKKIAIAALTVTTLSIPSIAYAASVADGELNFTGGQTSEVVYSDIIDAKPDNDKLYKLMAKVKVGGNTYISGWQDDYAYVEADRKWYANEHSYYDYYQRN